MAEALWTPRPLPGQRPAERTIGRWRPNRAADLTASRRALSAVLHEDARHEGASEEAVERLLLAFEELASNAVRHGRPPVEISVTTAGDRAWLLAVSDDAGDTPPTPAVGRDAALGGLGLHMVATLADDYGWTSNPDGGKTVWVRIAFDRTDGTAGDAGPVSAGVPAQAATVGIGARSVTAAHSGPPVTAPVASRRDGTAAAGRAWSVVSRRRPHGLAVLTAAAVLVLTAVLTVAAWQTNRRNNEDLLQRQVAQAAAVLSTQVAVLQTRLGDAGQVADATAGAPGPFQRFAAAEAGSPAVSYSLWRITGGRAHLLAVQGPPPRGPAGGAAAFLTGVRPTGQLTVAGILPGGTRLAYALMPAGETTGLVVYVESPLPPHRRVTVKPGAAFSALEVAVYLGRGTAADQLLEATSPTPLAGRTASTRVPIGDKELTVVGASPTPLTGGLSAALPWLVLGVGALIALGGGVLVDTITRRRRVAERLAATSEELYQQQRGIAEDLQHALLPAVPTVSGLQVAARYRAGVDTLDVGGDWYDIVEVAPGRVVFLVGDVSGRGLPAATTMAALRFAVRGFLSEGHAIEGVLSRLRGLLDVTTDHQFATVLIGELDVTAGRLRLLSAGHFPPLLVIDGQARSLDCPVAPPVGVDTVTAPPPVTIELPPSATLLAFSDGLVEHRGEDLDAGLARLADVAGGESRPLEETLDRLLDQLTDPGGKDDTVLLALRWQDTSRGGAGA